MAQIYEARLKYLRYGIRHKYVAKDLNILYMPSMCGKRLKYVGNDVYMWEMA